MLDCAPLLDCARLEGKTLIDVGTGAGFPGMVLKILVPSLNVTLLDSLQKRLDWLDGVAADLSLTGVRTIHGRGGGGGAGPRAPGAFDFATARRWPTCVCCARCACPSSGWAGDSSP